MCHLKSPKQPTKKSRNSSNQTKSSSKPVSKADYLTLRRHYDRLLAAEGFKDLEFMKSDGTISPYFTHKATASLRLTWTAGKEEYWRNAGLFLHHYDWTTVPKLSPAMARYVWYCWTEGLTYEQIPLTWTGAIAAPVHKGRLPLKRFRKARRRTTESPSVFWIHTVLNDILGPVFEEWLVQQRLPGGLLDD